MLLGVVAMAGTIGTGGVVVSAQTVPSMRGQGPITVQAGGGAEAAAMVQTARQRGQMRVIVGLADPAVPEGQLSVAAVGAQRARLASAQTAVAAGLRQGAVTKFESIPFMVVDTDAAGLESLLSDSRVATVQEDVAVPLALTQSVPLIKADQAAARGFGGKGQVVAILDTGVAKNHPMLKGKVVAEACYSTTNKKEAATSLCPGGVQSSTAAGSTLIVTPARSACSFIGERLSRSSQPRLRASFISSSTRLQSRIGTPSSRPTCFTSTARPSYSGGSNGQRPNLDLPQSHAGEHAGGRPAHS